MEGPGGGQEARRQKRRQRDVVRLVTPGTLTEDTLLDAQRQQLPGRDRARARLGAGGRQPLRARLPRHLDRRVSG